MNISKQFTMEQENNVLRGNDPTTVESLLQDLDRLQDERTKRWTKTTDFEEKRKEKLLLLEMQPKTKELDLQNTTKGKKLKCIIR